MLLQIIPPPEINAVPSACAADRVVFPAEVERACAGAIGTAVRASAAIKAKLSRMWESFMFFMTMILLV
jgi:hypothetical protein